MQDSEWNPTISGLADIGGVKFEGFGTVILFMMIDEQLVHLMLDYVLYVPGAGCNLFSPGLALDQGINMSWDASARLFGMTKDNLKLFALIMIIDCGLLPLTIASVL